MDNKTNINAVPQPRMVNSPLFCSNYEQINWGDRCKKHPQYKAILPPKVPRGDRDCVCWELYDAKNRQQARIVTTEIELPNSTKVGKTRHVLMLG